MNAEALIGTVLGTCTLQKLIGQGGMGAVYLAQQSRPRRQVAVKVLLPMTPLSPHQLVAFLERFRRETDAAASLEHPNITPVHEYGERDGLAYLVMPYINGGTLRDELERTGPLPLEIVAKYLDQMADALDCAHDHGVIHRDIKPANILLTTDGRLLLTDFGLVKIVAEGRIPQVRLTGPGAPVGTPDYMAPEQVIGEDVDSRADLYSLGVLLFQMVTGTTPFHGETPMQIATQHLQAPPPAPHIFRPDLPPIVEQVILRALAKRPEDRYQRGEELADAFRTALMNVGIVVDLVKQGTGKLSSVTGRFRSPKGLFDPPPTWQPAVALPSDRDLTANMPAVNTGLTAGMSLKLPAAHNGSGLLRRGTGALPAMPNDTSDMESSYPSGGGLLSRTGKFPLVGTGATGQLPVAMPAAFDPQTALLSPPAEQGVTVNRTDALAALGQPEIRSTKLTGPVKVVQVPLAGQPGRFVTGLLPLAQESPGKKNGKRWVKITALITLFVLLIGSVSGGALWYFGRFNQQDNPKNQQVATGGNQTAGTPDPKASIQAQVTATAQANVLFSDPLSQNNHNWLTTPPDVYAFKDGAYHITAKGNNGRATILQASPFSSPLVYTLTMQQVKGDDKSNTNSFGMLFRFNQQNKSGKTVTTFYSFEVVNTKGGEYQFWLYNDSDAKAASPWKKIWFQPFGNEFHQGQGANATNTFKVAMDGKDFTFAVNGKKIKAAQDGTLTSGSIGMIVNQDGTEIAFKNLLLTRS
jgi:serine/threonine protein kinase